MPTKEVDLERSRSGKPRYRVDENGCWIWLGATARGYGAIKVDERQQSAHRVYYEAFIEAIPDGLQIDHLCRNRACVNPAHLEPVTGRENLLRGETLAAENTKKTHCPKGHPLEGDNLGAWELKRGKRSCRRCHADRERRRKENQE